MDKALMQAMLALGEIQAEDWTIACKFLWPERKEGRKETVVQLLKDTYVRWSRDLFDDFRPFAS